ncbi:MAG: ATPase, partial [Clostridiales bacterium]|nr:ATPase [Clostridiales bacterium]
MDKDVLRLPAEKLYEKELEALMEEDKAEKPNGWRLSPKAALKFITGGKASGVDVTAKYIGNKRLAEMAIATLLTDRALLLIG